MILVCDLQIGALLESSRHFELFGTLDDIGDPLTAKPRAVRKLSEAESDANLLSGTNEDS